MNEALQRVHSEYRPFVITGFTAVLHTRIDDHIRFLRHTHKLQEELFAKGPSHIVAYKKSLIEAVEQYFEQEENLSFDKDYLVYNQQTSNYLASLAETLTIPQHPDRFQVLENDAVKKKLGKFFKRLLRAISYWPARITNAFRKLFKKPIKPLKPWSHTVHFQNITTYYLQKKLSIALIEQWNDMYPLLAKSSGATWKVDEYIDAMLAELLSGGEAKTFDKEMFLSAEAYIPKLQRFKEGLEEKIVAQYDTIFEEYADTFEKAGTIELSNSRFSVGKIAAKHRELESVYQHLRKGWNNTLLALSDDWEIDIELYIIIYASLEQYKDLCQSLQHRIHEVIFPRLDEIKEMLNASREKLKAAKTKPQLKKALEAEVIALGTDLESKLIPTISELLLSQDFPALVNAVEAMLEKQISTITAKRAVVKGAMYDTPIKNAAINYISPFELINFESWPQLQKMMKVVKATTTGSISTAQNDLLYIGRIGAFNLQSALSLYDQEHQNGDPIAIAEEGIDRTLEKVEEIKAGLLKFTGLWEEEIRAGLEKFHRELIQFTDNENIYEIRVRIAKGKAMARSREIRKNLVARVKNALPTIVIFVKTKYNAANTAVTQLFRKYGLTQQQNPISTELADFLAETAQSIEKLPYVYQRLFKSEPLTDENFFEGRTRELQALNNAYNNWMKGRFAATAVVGEKGSGITTLFNFYLKDLASGSKVFRFSPSHSTCTVVELLALFSIHFGQKFSSMDDVAIFLNTGGKKIIVLENIQKLYLKRVHGFAAITALTDLISLTGKNVFWVIGVTRYAWQFLDKTFRLSSHFSYITLLDEFDEKALVNIIKKRHRVSGYNVRFEPSASELNSRKYKKLTEDEKQEYLAETYYRDLTRIAGDNISVALIYWLRSTEAVDGNTIVINTLEDMDFSFMTSLTQQDRHALMQLLIHDGLSLEDYCQVTHQEVGAARAALSPLYEDGIIIVVNGLYLINPLLYRQTVALLKAKNIIH